MDVKIEMMNNSNRVKEFACDDICKYTSMGLNEDEFENKCENCLINKIKYCVFGSDKTDNFIEDFI